MCNIFLPHLSEKKLNSESSGDESGSDLEEFKKSNKLGADVSITDVLEKAKQNEFKVHRYLAQEYTLVQDYILKKDGHLHENSQVVQLRANNLLSG